MPLIAGPWFEERDEVSGITVWVRELYSIERPRNIWLALVQPNPGRGNWFWRLSGHSRCYEEGYADSKEDAMRIADDLLTHREVKLISQKTALLR